MSDTSSRGGPGTPSAAGRTACATSFDVIFTVPAEADDAGAGTRSDGRPRLGDPVLDAVEALLHPLPHRERAVRIVRVQGAGVDARAGRDALRDQILETRDRLVSGPHAVDRVHDALLHLEDRLHLQHRAEERLRPGHAPRTLQVLEGV